MSQPGSEFLHRIRLRSHARPLRRGAGQVQFGLNAEHGVVLGGLSDAEVTWILSLSTRSREGFTDTGGGGTAATGVPSTLNPAHRGDLIDLLRAHNLLVHPPQGHVARQVSSWEVSVLGSGSTTRGIRDGLAAVPSVKVWDALAPGRRTDMALLVVNDAVSPSDAAAWARSGLRHAPVVVDRHRVLVGPLVEPHEGPCLACLDLRRADRDPAWPLVAAQFDTMPSEWAAPVNADAALSAAATGLCALLVAALAQGTRVPLGVTWEVNTPLPQVTTRHWLQHPLCSAHTESRQSRTEPKPHAAC